MNIIKTSGIPIWVTLFAVVTVLLGLLLGGMAFLGQGHEGFMVPTWGGRNLGLALAMILAIVFKSPVAYLAAFAGGFAREAGDLVQELAKDEPSTGVIIGVIVFMLLCAVGAFFANNARKI